VAELQEEVTQVHATAIMVGAQTPRAERVAQERDVLLASACVEADEAVQRVSLLEGELVAVRRAQDTTEEKLSSLVE
jgi:hypothetical protein